MNATGGRLANVSGAVLMGGAASRMGHDKARLVLAGVPLATRLASRLDALFEDVLLVGGDPPPDAPGRRVPDVDGPRSGLRGVASALEAARCERVLLLATDLPLVSNALLLGLCGWPEADAVVARDEHGLQPLCGVYRREVALAQARARLSQEQLALRGWLDALDARALPQDVMARLDPDGSALTNLNTPEDLARAEQQLAREAAPLSARG